MARTEEILGKLRVAGSEYECYVASLPPESGEDRLEPDGWSVLLVAEHVVLAERAMLEMFRAGQITTSLGESHEERLAIVMANRLARAKAPVPVTPTGRFRSLAEAVGEFAATRGETMQMFREDRRDMAALVCKHPMVGPVNGYEMMVLVMGHANRHLAQIREIVAAK